MRRLLLLLTLTTQLLAFNNMQEVWLDATERWLMADKKSCVVLTRLVNSRFADPDINLVLQQIHQRDCQ